MTDGAPRDDGIVILRLTPDEVATVVAALRLFMSTLRRDDANLIDEVHAILARLARDA